MHKTGTTSIQTTFFKSQTALERQGVTYPIRYTLWGGHHQIPWALGINHGSRAVDFNLDKVLSDYFKLASGETLVLSSEDFELVQPAPLTAFLPKLLQHGTVDAVCYFRHPGDWIESAFKWHALKEPNRFRDIQHYMSDNRAERWLDYFGKANNWFEAGANFMPRLYTRNVVGDFLSVVGASNIKVDRHDNTSIRSLTARIVIELIKSGPVTMDEVSRIDAHVRAITDKDCRLLSPFLLESLMNRVSPNIKRFVDKFMPEEHSLLDRTWKAPTLDQNETRNLIDQIVASTELSR